MNSIHTPRLTLSLYRDEDKQSFIELLTDPDVMSFVDRGVLTSEQAEALWHKLVNELYPTGVDTIWSVIAIDDGRFIGNASVRPRPVKPDDWEIAYYLVKDEWGKGYATELARHLASYALEDLGLPAVYATVDPRNDPSINVLRKVGFKFHSEESDDLGPYSVYILHRADFPSVNFSS